MATPLGHSIVGYALARAMGVKSPQGMGLAIGAASLPDVDFLLGYVANGDVLSLHREVITHKPVFPLLVGAATGVVLTVASIVRGKKPTAGEVLRPSLLATALVASHVVTDRLPVPYDTTPIRSRSMPEVLMAQAWNAVVDAAVYGTLASFAFERKRGRAHA